MSQVVLSGMNILRLDLTHFRTLWKIVGLSMSFYSEKLVLERARWSTGLLGRRLHEPSQTSTDAPRLAGHIHSSRMVHRTPFGTSLAWTSRWQAMRDICVASCNLVRDLTKVGGIDLLLFCHRQGHITTIAQKNYALLYEVACRKSVPYRRRYHTLGERYEGLVGSKNAEIFERRGFKFCGHGCVTTLSEDPKM